LGPDIHCDCGRIAFRAGSYSWYGEFRNMLAKFAGLELKWVVFPNSFGQIKIYTYEALDETKLFYELLAHSDCDGELSYEECEELQKDFR